MDEREEPTKVMSRAQPDRADDTSTREMDPNEFRALIERARGERSQTIPATHDRLQELVAQMAEPEDDLAIPVESSASFAKQPALIVEDPETGQHPRHDEVEDRDVVLADLPHRLTRLPTAPATNARLYVLVVLLAVAIAGALAFYQLG